LRGKGGSSRSDVWGQKGSGGTEPVRATVVSCE
jgi:hypothetical protein